MQNLALKVAGCIFVIVAIMQLLRVLFKVKIVVNDNIIVPIWLSVVASIVALLLALFMFACLQ